MGQTLSMVLMLVFAVAALLYLIIRHKVHAFIALIVVSMLTGLIAGIPLSEIMGTMQAGMGNNLGFIAVVIGLGAMFGKMLEVTGGAERLARTLVGYFGKEKAAYAMVLAGFIISIPVFFDVGFIILVPLVYSLAKETNSSVLKYGIPLLAGLAVTHAFVPPTPGPVAVASLLGADLGQVIFFGIIAGIPAAILAGPVWGNRCSQKINAPVPDYMEFDDSTLKISDADLPSFKTVVLLIAIPIVLILLNTTVAALVEGDGLFKQIVAFVGHPFMALTIATIATFVTLGRFKGLTKEEIQDICTASLAPTGMILLVTGAGGVLKQVLTSSDIGRILAEGLAGSSLSPILLAFLIATVVRVSVGSATVAMMTSGGIMAPLLTTSSVNPALVVIAIASGSTVLSHVNDTGFWLVNRYLGLNEKDTLRSWTVMETIIGCVGVVVCLVIDKLFF